MPTRELHLLEARVESVQAGSMRSMKQRFVTMVMCLIVISSTGAASAFTRVVIGHTLGHCGDVVVVQWRMQRQVLSHRRKAMVVGTTLRGRSR